VLDVAALTPSDSGNTSRSDDISAAHLNKYEVRTRLIAFPTRGDLSMTSYVALLRAVNVGGTGKLPMSELKAMCEVAGFEDVRTYIASGNVVFTSKLAERTVKRALEQQLQDYAGKPVGVTVRSAAELAAVLAANPFAEAPGNRTVAIFLDASAPATALQNVTGEKDEQLALGKREICVHYGDGMADSRLKIPAAKSGTARNMNTIAKLAEMAAQHKGQ
jgi:uncharacterized protein (DUF1697 family)